MEVMKIGADLRLAFPVRWVELPVLRKLGESDEDWAKREGETTLEPSIWAYHTPINRSVFEANYRAISAAYTSIWSKGQLFVLNTGPIIATLALRSAAREDALESGVDMKGDAAMPLLSEIKRLTMIVAPGKSGYDPLPVDVAIRQNVIDAEDWTEAEAAVVFFTCAYWMAKKKDRQSAVEGLARVVLKGSITSSALTEFIASLPTLTRVETSAALIPSLVPS